MLVGTRVHARFVGTLSVRLTVPANPLMAATVIVEFADLTDNTVALVGFATMLKSTPVTVTVVEIENGGEMEVAVTLITALPDWAPAETTRVTLWLPPETRLTLEGVT
jgi:hypothetical protein